MLLLYLKRNYVLSVYFFEIVIFFSLSDDVVDSSVVVEDERLVPEIRDGKLNLDFITAIIN